MKKLIEIVRDFEERKAAVGHFNVSDLAGLKAVFEAAKKLSLPVIIGVSEGERDFIGVNQISALIKSLRKQYDYPIYLNADHTKSLEKLKEAVEAGFDSAVFDPFGAAQGERGTLEENIKKTAEAVKIAKSTNPDFLVEGELGYIGSGSVVLKEIPEGAAIKTEDLTKPEDAERFVKETGIDLFAPAVGNIHGIIAGGNPKIDIERIKAIREAVGVPLVLHGGSGITDKEFLQAIDVGISVIHINTELRVAWRKGLDSALKQNSDEIVPYKVLPAAVDEIRKVVEQRLQLFNKLI